MAGLRAKQGSEAMKFVAGSLGETGMVEVSGKQDGVNIYFLPPCRGKIKDGGG